jgi:hypothetical protein
VSGKGLGDDVAIDAQQHHRAKPIPGVRDQVVELLPLGHSPRDPHERLVRHEGRLCRMRIRGLGVVHIRDARNAAHCRDAMRRRNEVAQSVAHRGGGHPERAGKGRRRECVGNVVRRKRVNIGNRPDFLGRVGSIHDESTVDKDVLDHAQHAYRGHPQGEADRAAALHHVRVLDQEPGRIILHVVDRRHLRVMVDPGLGRNVVLERAEVIDVVIRDIQAHRGDRAHGVNER